MRVSITKNKDAQKNKLFAIQFDLSDSLKKMVLIEFNSV